MSERSPDQIRELLDALYRLDSGRILTTLIRLLGDFDLAEEAMHEAFAAALSLWPKSGVPGNPRPWLISTARFKAIDTLRRRARFDASQDQLVRLRLIFTGCHPSLALEARVALTLREGLAGRTPAQMTESITAALVRKELLAMESGAMCYMLSKQGYGGDSIPHWPPHLNVFLFGHRPRNLGSESAGFPHLWYERPCGASDAVRDSRATEVWTERKVAKPDCAKGDKRWYVIT